jgi:hypothetical protein
MDNCSISRLDPEIRFLNADPDPEVLRGRKKTQPKERLFNKKSIKAIGTGTQMSKCDIISGLWIQIRI